jgi:hypothetical protein
MYKEYYNFLNEGTSALYFIIPGVLFIVLSSLIFLLYIKKSKNKSKFISRMIIFSIGFSFLWTAIASKSLIGNYLFFRNILLNKEYLEVEGYVENFNPMPYEGHQLESFKVKGITFKYSDFVVSSGFNNTKSHGGPIDEGKYVKIDYYNNTILKLWIMEETNK